MKSVLVALSGGVDSAVAALLLKQQGFAVHGAYMRTWMDEENSGILADCPWREDIRHARAVAEHLGIPFEIVNLIDDYRRTVVKYLVDGYKTGTTPNPDVMCNREIKFGILKQYATDNGFDALATGHYARISSHPGTDGPLIQCGVDPNKDQTYFLAMVPSPAFRHVLFPVGHYLKPQIRQLAADGNLPNADRKDSQGICFLGRVPINRFLEQYIPDSPGEIINHKGAVVGEHRGLHHFTIGQRKGIGVPSNHDFEHYVVVAKDYQTNTLHIAFDHPETEGLWHQVAIVRNLNPIVPLPSAAAHLLARPRYRDPLVGIDYQPLDSDTVRITFERPQRALAAGQVVAFHDGEQLLGGGIYTSFPQS